MQLVYATIITIGDELLIGQTIDTNSAWIAQELNKIGVLVRKRVAISDNANEITQTLSHELTLADIVIITGGLGPTNDDLTKPVLTSYFGDTLVYDELVLQHLTSFFEKRKRPMLDINKNQALVPSRATVLYNEMGTAPGLLFKQKHQLVFALPGVPFEMKHLMSTYVLHHIAANFKTPKILHRTLVTAGEGESFIAARLASFEQRLPSTIKLAYLPKLSIVKLRLTGIHIEPSLIDQYFEMLQQELSDIVFTNEDKELIDVVSDLLHTNHQTIATAESCTGGQIASQFTSIPKASAIFKGSVVAYTNDAKTSVLGVSPTTINQYSAVHEQTAKEMLSQCLQRFSSDYAIATTGYLNKGDHQNEVWIAVGNKEQIVTKMITVPYDREKNAVLTINTALLMLQKLIIATS